MRGMKFFDRLLFAACAGAILLALSACSGESTDAADAQTTLSPGGVYTVSQVTLLAADPATAQARRVTASTEKSKGNKGENANEGEGEENGEGEGEGEEEEEKEEEEEEEPAAPPIAAGSSFTLSATPASSGFALSFSLPDGSSFSATASAPAVGEPSGSHQSYRAGDTIATFSVTGPVQGEITVRATVTIEATVSGGSVTNVSTNAVSPGASSSTNGPATVTNVSFSASSSSSVTPANSSLAAELTFPSFQLSATASGPSGTISW